jgi:hypothetical protein
VWDENRQPINNYVALGKRLAEFRDLYRHSDFGQGLILLPGTNTRPIQLSKGRQLAALLIDRIPIRYVKDGEARGGLIPAKHLTLLLCTEAFLTQFPPFDQVAQWPEDFDSLRHALGLLGAAKPNVWLRSGEWANQTVELGLVGRVIPPADRENESSRERGIGVVLSRHAKVTLKVKTEAERLTLRLEKGRRRFEAGNEPTTKYRFVILDRKVVPEDAPRDNNKDSRSDEAQTNGQARKVM